MKFKDLTGLTFGRLAVIAPAGSVNGKMHFRCLCSCGSEAKISSFNLQNGHTASCGCLNRERTTAAKRTHGRSQSRLYRVWRAMINRCTNENQKCYPAYGGRGITVCDRWMNSFAAFLADMGECPPGMQLDRKDNARGYAPENCRWVTRKVNCRNRRSTRLLTHAGRTQSIAEWAEELGLRYGLIRLRIRRGWSPERALTALVEGSHVGA